MHMTVHPKLDYSEIEKDMPTNSGSFFFGRKIELSSSSISLLFRVKFDSMSTRAKKKNTSHEMHLKMNSCSLNIYFIEKKEEREKKREKERIDEIDTMFVVHFFFALYDTNEDRIIRVSLSLASIQIEFSLCFSSFI